MKPLKFIILFSFTSLLVASSAFAFEPKNEEAARLAKILNGKIMSCSPASMTKSSDPDYRGDEGFFKLKIVEGNIKVFDNGGSGFGFANGNIRDLHVGDEDMFLSVGDDGYQNLTLHIDDFVLNKPYCAEGRMISYFDGFHSGGDKLDTVNCCLE